MIKKPKVIHSKSRPRKTIWENLSKWMKLFFLVEFTFSCLLWKYFLLKFNNYKNLSSQITYFSWILRKRNQNPWSSGKCDVPRNMYTCTITKTPGENDNMSILDIICCDLRFSPMWICSHCFTFRRFCFLFNRNI